MLLNSVLNATGSLLGRVVSGSAVPPAGVPSTTAQSTPPTQAPAFPAESGGVSFDFSEASLDDLATADNAAAAATEETPPAVAPQGNTPETVPQAEAPAEVVSVAVAAVAPQGNTPETAPQAQPPSEVASVAVAAVAPAVQGSATARGTVAAAETDAASAPPTRGTASTGNASEEERIRAWAVGMLARERLGSLSLTPAKTAALPDRPVKSLAGESANLQTAPAARTLARA